MVLFTLRLPFVFHSPVLKPNFDLPLGEVQQSGDFHTPWPAEILVEVELLLQLQQLSVSVRRSESASCPSATIRNLGRAYEGITALYIIDTPLIITLDFYNAAVGLKADPTNLSNILRFSGSINCLWEWSHGT